MSKPKKRSTLSSELIDHFRIDAQIFDEYTLIFTPVRGRRNAKQQEKWIRRKREIGQGSFGTVWLEERIDGGERAVRAVKEVRKTLGLGKGFEADYARELYAMARLTKHYDHFVEFYGWYESTHSIFLSMEYFSLGDLGHWISAPFPEAEAQDISRQILEGLEILHRDKITHRDLKPQNIFVVEKPPSSAKWWVKIGDFGISKRLGEETTSFGTEVGTANYMAPELPDGETYKFTNAVDMWAFGCILYLLLAWRMPFPDLKNRKKFARAGTDVPIQPLLDRFLSSMAIDFVTKLLAANPDHRPSAQNALESPWMTTKAHLNPEVSLSDSPAMCGTLSPSARDKSSTPRLVGSSAEPDGDGTAIPLPRQYEKAIGSTRPLDSIRTFPSPNDLDEQPSEHDETLMANHISTDPESTPGFSVLGTSPHRTVGTAAHTHAILHIQSPGEYLSPTVPPPPPAAKSFQEQETGQKK